MNRNPKTVVKFHPVDLFPIIKWKIHRFCRQICLFRYFYRNQGSFVFFADKTTAFTASMIGLCFHLSGLTTNSGDCAHMTIGWSSPLYNRAKMPYRFTQTESLRQPCGKPVHGCGQAPLVHGFVQVFHGAFRFTQIVLPRPCCLPAPHHSRQWQLSGGQVAETISSIFWILTTKTRRQAILTMIGQRIA